MARQKGIVEVNSHSCIPLGRETAKEGKSESTILMGGDNTSLSRLIFALNECCCAQSHSTLPLQLDFCGPDDPPRVVFLGAAIRTQSLTTLADPPRAMQIAPRPLRSTRLWQSYSV